MSTMNMMEPAPSYKFRLAGWDVTYHRDRVTVTDKKGRTYLVCMKRHGGTDYQEELEETRQLLIKQGLFREKK